MKKSKKKITIKKIKNKRRQREKKQEKLFGFPQLFEVVIIPTIL